MECSIVAIFKLNISVEANSHTRVSPFWVARFVAVALLLLVLLLLLLLLLLLYDMDVSCHRPFLPGTSLEPAVNPTAQASSFTLHHTAVLSVLCVMFQV
jgi:hypothetical protein